MTPSLNVLVTAASRRVPLVRAFRRALAEAGATGRVVVTDVNPLSPAVHVADAAYEVPLSTDPDYLAVIRGICVEEAVGLVVPTIDDELPAFAQAVDEFRQEGMLVAVSSLDTTLACNDKYKRVAGCVRPAWQPRRRFSPRRFRPSWPTRSSSSLDTGAGRSERTPCTWPGTFRSSWTS